MVIYNFSLYLYKPGPELGIKIGPKGALGSHEIRSKPRTKYRYVINSFLTKCIHHLTLYIIGRWVITKKPKLNLPHFELKLFLYNNRFLALYLDINLGRYIGTYL